MSREANPRKILKLGVLGSHGGSNLQSIINACKSRCLNARICVVISNNSESGVLKRAQREDIASYHFSRTTHPCADQLDANITRALERHNVDLVLLAGYMRKLGPKVLSRYHGRVLNIHPSLLPDFGGEGMYGKSVHEAVLEAGVKTTGVTIHLVDDQYDHGPIVAQWEVPVLGEDTVDSLADRVLKVEHKLYVETLKKIARNHINLASLTS